MFAGEKAGFFISYQIIIIFTPQRFRNRANSSLGASYLLISLGRKDCQTSNYALNRANSALGASYLLMPSGLEGCRTPNYTLNRANSALCSSYLLIACGPKDCQAPNYTLTLKCTPWRLIFRENQLISFLSIPRHPRSICAKFRQNWPSSSKVIGKEIHN